MRVALRSMFAPSGPRWMSKLGKLKVCPLSISLNVNALAGSRHNYCTMSTMWHRWCRVPSTVLVS